ncbi:peritrophin-44 [Drosophila sulfurigaster albostrigata]|uniref:peritrophin-44 n=1 Tax=Drosophila sulfurigaster albostrigata TaxID=89887 RepID=UPI002D21B7C1|nr:peritrophin-44 [Drosophila sulfurigaster albostrigata]
MLSRSTIAIFLLAIVCVVQPSSGAVNNYAELCRLFKNGTLVRKPGSCSEYIECINYAGTMKKCSNDLVFNASSGKCEAATAANSVYCGNLCEGLNGLWVADPTDCQNYFYCDNGKSLAGHCPGSQHFDEANQMCQYGVDSLCVDVANICHLVPDKTKFRQENDCNEYYECKSGSHSLSSCSSTQYFDVESASCKAKYLVSCTAHSKKNVCLKTSLSSSTPITGYVADGATCRGYFYCGNYGTVHDVDPVWSQCPEGLFYDDAAKKCNIATEVVCTYNRCDGRGTMLVASSSNNCHNFIRCVDGVATEEQTCDWDYFFHEPSQACTSTIIYDGCCDGRD